MDQRESLDCGGVRGPCLGAGDPKCLSRNDWPNWIDPRHLPGGTGRRADGLWRAVLWKYSLVLAGPRVVTSDLLDRHLGIYPAGAFRCAYGRRWLDLHPAADL